MSEATRFEVMSYWEAKAIAQQSPMVLVTNMGQASSGILSSILTLKAGLALDTFMNVLPEYLSKAGGFATLFPTLDIENIDNVIEGELWNEYASIIIAMKGGLGEGVGGMLASLYETTVGTNALLTSYRSLLQRIAIDPYIQRWANTTYRPNIPDTETSWFMQQIGAITRDQFKDCAHQAGWTDGWLAPLESAMTRQPNLETLLDFKRRGYFDENGLRAVLKWYRFTGETLENTIKMAVQYPEPYRLAEMHTKGLLSHDDYFKTMGYFGIEYDYAQAWAGAQLQMPNFDQCLALLRRGVITEDDVRLYMNYQQYGDYQTNQMLTLKEVIPPIQDLIRFAIREAYGEHDPEKQYPAMVEIAGKMGLTPEAAEWYWYAHWERIPINLMFANYHRGLWDKTKLERMLKIVDIHPDDRQDIMNVAFVPPSIRELGYGYDVGAYTLEDIKRYRRFGGLSPEDAEKAGKAMVAYRTEAERNAVRMEYLYAFSRGEIDEEGLDKRLFEIGTAPEAVPLWMERARLYANRVLKPTVDMEGKLVSSSEALTAFKLGLRDADWTKNALKDLNWIDDRITVAMERAEREKAESEEQASEVKYRKLTLAQLQKMYQLQIINKEQMVTEITLIGYNPDDAELLTEIYTRDVAEAIKPKVFSSAVAANMYDLCIYDEDDLLYNFTEQGWSDDQAALLVMYTLIYQRYPLLRTMYSKGAISGEDMVKELMKLEMPEFNARQLVAKTYEEYQVDRVSHEKDLTKAEIIKGAKNNVLLASQAAELLVGIGYDENEAYYILAINKVVEAGDPEGYWDMRRVTESYKKAKGQPYVVIPDEIFALEKLLKDTKAERDKIMQTTKDENDIAGLTLKIGSIEGQMKQLIIAKGLK